MFIDILITILGAALVLVGADKLTDGAVGLARRFQIPELVIGLTIVAFGTSLPEFIVSLLASFNHAPAMSIGNIVGSNLFNTLMIVGFSALFCPIVVSKTTVAKDIPFSLLASVVLPALALDVMVSGGAADVLTRGDGLVLLSFFTIFMAYTFSMAKSGNAEVEVGEGAPMSFLRTQNIKRDAQNNIISGSASIMNTVYDNTRAHKSKQVVLEKLGKVLWLSENGRSGIFLNPQRGLFHYDSSTGEFSSVPSDDPRLPREMDEKPVRHVVFGTTDLFLHFLEKLGYTEMLKNIFPTKPDFQRVICHLAHKFLKDGSHVHVDDFIERTLLSYYATDISTGSLRCDTRYFTMMGDERVKIAFFRELVKMYRKSSPDFGKCCLIDSTPLPNDIDNNPFNALSCHGIGGAAEQTRLVLVLDKDTGIPVWYELIPGNVLDINTLTQIRNAVMEFLELEIAEYTLDAGY
jgi:Ca2+/Na+ antiporter